MFTRIDNINRPQWLEQRKKGIGGSEASAIIGLNPYKTNIQLWEEKLGIREQEDISDKPYVKYGTEAEQWLIEIFKLDFPQYEVVHNDFQTLQNNEYKFLFASLDGELVENDTGRKGFLEIKTTNILNIVQKQKWKNQIPDNYYVQCLHYFIVTGFDFCILKAQLKSVIDGELRIETRHYPIERKDVENDIKCLREKEIEFWNEYVLKQRKPGLILPNI